MRFEFFFAFFCIQIFAILKSFLTIFAYDDIINVLFVSQIFTTLVVVAVARPGDNCFRDFITTDLTFFGTFFIILIEQTSDFKSNNSNKIIRDTTMNQTVVVLQEVGLVLDIFVSVKLVVVVDRVRSLKELVVMRLHWFQATFKVGRQHLDTAAVLQDSVVHQMVDNKALVDLQVNNKASVDHQVNNKASADHQVNNRALVDRLVVSNKASVDPQAEVIHQVALKFHKAKLVSLIFPAVLQAVA